MDNSWVKLYRKLGDNEIMYDASALQVFIWLLIRVNKSTGEIRTGRFIIAESLELNPSTVYKILKRLEEKYKIVTLRSNNKFTTISLSNWAKYQSQTLVVTQSGNNKVTTKEQQSNTIQEYKNKRIKKIYIYNIYFQKFLENFNTFYKSSYKETKKVNELYNLRRKVFTSEEIDQAFTNMTRIPFYRGKNDSGWKPTPEFVLRSDEKINELLNSIESKPAQTTEYQIDEDGIARIRQMKKDAGL